MRDPQRLQTRYIYVTTYMSEVSYDQKCGIYYISILRKNIVKQLCYS